jgi:hypothetical protein
MDLKCALVKKAETVVLFTSFMEIQLLSPGSIKIKGKNASVVFDPTSKADAEIVIATKALDTLTLDRVSNTRLIVSGPGEYEAGGISISGKKVKDKMIYVFTESLKVAVVNSEIAGELPDDEDFDAVVVHVDTNFSDEVLGPISTKCIVLYGDLAQATVKSENTEKTNKVNLKKSSEVAGKTFLLV